MVILYLIIIMCIFIYVTTMNFLDFGPVLYSNLIVSLVALVNLLIYEIFKEYII